MPELLVEKGALLDVDLAVMAIRIVLPRIEPARLRSS